MLRNFSYEQRLARLELFSPTLLILYSIGLYLILSRFISEISSPDDYDDDEDNDDNVDDEFLLERDVTF